jgi:hypothetical protein
MPTIEPLTQDTPWQDCENDFDEGKDTWREVTKEHYWYALEVLPPIHQTRQGFLMGEPWKHKYGEAVYLAFANLDDRYFARYCTLRTYFTQFVELVGELRRLAQQATEKSQFNE